MPAAFDFRCLAPRLRHKGVNVRDKLQGLDKLKWGVKYQWPVQEAFR